MRSSTSFRNLHVWYVALVLSLPLLAACDRADPGLVAPEHDGEVTFRFDHSMTGEETSTGTFAAEGAIGDEGRFGGTLVLGGPNEAPTILYGGQLLTGKQGSVAIEYTGVFDKGRRTARGWFSMWNATGAYAQMERQKGDFEMTLTGAASRLRATSTFVVPSSRR